MGAAKAHQVLREPEAAVRKTDGTVSASSRWTAQELVLQLQRGAGNRAVVGLLGGSAGPTASGVAQRAGGEPLDTDTRGFMEARLGQDFSGVRVHHDPMSSASAEALGARAYTVGDDIMVSRRAAVPGSREGRRTLAHELAHVVQQRRGGRPPNLDDRGRLEDAADRAAAQVMDGGGMVAVQGAAGPSVMCQPEEDEERAAEVARRRAEKHKTQQRRQERAAAGKEPVAQSQAAAERELRALEESYRKPGAQQRSVKRKAGDLERFRSLLKLAQGTALEKNKRQGDFDELQRTPTSTAEKPQTKHVAGGPQLPSQELRPGRDRYAQPDFSVWRHNKDGSVERLRVNLKSHNLRGLTPAQARATAKACVAQAISNSRHLATGDTIVISFAQTPTPEVQEVMRAELFRKGSPVGEVRFGTTTHRSQDYKPPAPPTETMEAPKAPKATKAGTAAAAAAPPAEKPATPKPAAPAPPAPAPKPAAPTPAAEEKRAAPKPAASTSAAEERPASTRPKVEERPAKPARPSLPPAKPAPRTIASPRPEPAAPKPKPAEPPAARPKAAPAAEEGHGVTGSGAGPSATQAATATAAAGAGAAIMAKSMGELNQLAADHPRDEDLVDTVKTVNDILAAKSFIENPTGFVAGAAKTALITAPFTHFNEVLAGHRQAFERRFPSVATLERDPVDIGISLQEFRTAHEKARADLRIPDARKALIIAAVALGLPQNASPEEVERAIAMANRAIASLPGVGPYAKRYFDARDRYNFALFAVTNQLNLRSDDLATLPADTADDLRRRARALYKAGGIMKHYSQQLWESPFIAFVPVLAAAHDLQTLAEGFDGLGRQMDEFATAAATRKGDYDRELQRLEAEGRRVGALSTRPF